MKLKKIAVIGIILIAACLSGCIGKDAIEGTYRCEADDSVLYLTADSCERLVGEQFGSYELLNDEANGGGGSFGVYSVRDDIVMLKVGFIDVIVPMNVDGRDLIDPDGDRWVRD